MCPSFSRETVTSVPPGSSDSVSLTFDDQCLTLDTRSRYVGGLNELNQMPNMGTTCIDQGRSEQQPFGSIPPLLPATALLGQPGRGPTHRLPWAMVGTISWLARRGRVLAFMRARCSRCLASSCLGLSTDSGLGPKVLQGGIRARAGGGGIRRK